MAFASTGHLRDDHLGLVRVDRDQMRQGEQSGARRLRVRGPRSVLPSTASASPANTSGVHTQPANACSKAATSSVLKSRCSVATLGAVRGGRPSASSRAGASASRRDSIGQSPPSSAPHTSSAAMLTCSIATSGSGDRPHRQPKGARPSGIAAKVNRERPRRRFGQPRHCLACQNGAFAPLLAHLHLPYPAPPPLLLLSPLLKRP